MGKHGLWTPVAGDVDLGQLIAALGEMRQSVVPPPESSHNHSRLGVTVTDTQSAPSGVTLTDVAVNKVRSLLEAEGRDDLVLRIAVQPGGCSGLRYQLYFDDRSLDGDVATDYDGVQLVTDKMSAPYLGGASIDFVDTIEKQGFTIDNPNAQGSCACGDSFH